MAVAVPDCLDQDELSRQAEALDRRADQLSEQARDLRQQAIELRLEVERHKREPVPILQRRIGVERDARLLARIGDTLGQIGPCTSTVLAEHLNVSQQRVRGALLHLESVKAVKRSGVRRGTVWGLADDEDLEGHGARASAYTLVLAAGQRLDTFDLDTLDAELQMLTRAGISRACRDLVADGKFSEAKDGRKKIYAFERPESKPVNRPKHAPPERKVIDMHRKRGTTIQGTGKRSRPTDKDVAELFDQIREAGAQITRQDNGHWRIMLRDQVLEVLPGTPSDWRSVRNARAKLRRAGLAI